MIILGSLESAHFIVDFLLVLIELFFTRCYGWGATSEYRFKIGDFAYSLQRVPVDPEFQVEGVAHSPRTNHSSSQKMIFRVTVTCGI